MKQFPTEDVIRQYKNDLRNAYCIKNPAERVEALNKVENWAEQYDWSHRVFTDETTGKKGVVDVEGTVIIPALYDDYPQVGTFRVFSNRQHVARKGDKYGIVSANGKGEALTGFVYDSLRWDPYTPFYIAQWGGEKKYFGLITHRGEVIVPCCITQKYQPHNNLLCYDCEDKKGIVDIELQCASLPIFSAIDLDPDTGLVTVTFEGVEGVLTADHLHFVPIDEMDEENGRYLHEVMY